MVDEILDCITNEDINYNEASKLVNEIFANEKISLVEPWFILINGSEGVRIKFDKECNIEIYDCKYLDNIGKFVRKYKKPLTLIKKY